MMKYLTFIFFLISTFNLSAQISDSTFFFKAREYWAAKEGREFLIEMCFDFIKEAKRKAANDSLCITENLYSFSAIAERILITDYGLYRDDGVNGDMIPEEQICYELIMEYTIKMKFSEHVFKKVITESDSLDQIRKGYLNLDLKIVCR